MVWISKTLWATGKLVIMDKCFFVLEGHVLIFENCVYGSALIKKIQYRPKGVPEEKMIWHMQQKKVCDVNSFPNIIFGKRYHTIYLKDPEYSMPVITTYVTLDNLERSETQHKYKVLVREVVTKWLNYRDVFGNQFCYFHHIYDNNNRRYSTIYLESTCEKTCTNRCHS